MNEIEIELNDLLLIKENIIEITAIAEKYKMTPYHLMEKINITKTVKV